MTLSKEARILLGIFAVLGLGFAGLHFSTQRGEPTPTAVSTPVPNRDRATGATIAPVAPEQMDQQASQAEEMGEPRVARELQVAQLPFLVTSPPAAPEAAPTLDVEGSEMPVTQASSGQRASVNPFSPLVVAQTDPAPEQNTQRVTDIPVQPQPQTAAAPTPAPRRRAPIPSARTPGTSAISQARLPRSLPTGTLSSTPDVLRSAISTPTDVQRTQNPLVAQSENEANEPNTSPLAAGSSDLSLYLRDQQVTFTGSVLGPVSVGIFRSANAPAPFLVPLGQTLPNTDIVLTDLTGQSAELSRNSDSQLLTLDSRR